MPNKSVVGKMIAVAAAAALCLAMPCLSGCGQSPEKGTSGQSQVSAEISDVFTFEDRVEEGFLNDGGFQYEKYKAAEVFGGKAKSPSDTKRNKWVEDYGECAFDTSGTGVFVVTDPEYAGMHHYMYYFETTSDKGKTWQVQKNSMYGSHYCGDIRISGKKVYLFTNSYVGENACVVFSDDLCDSFKTIDPLRLLPNYSELKNVTASTMSVLNFNRSTGETVVGFGDLEYSQNEKESFLIARFNGDFTEGKVLYSDEDYISSAANPS